MLALVTTPGHAHTTRVTEVPDAAAGPHEVLLRPLRVGVCGTDREISDGRFGVAPDSEQHLILGHELLARVEADGHGFARGDLVCATVRRSCRHYPACEQGSPDACLTGDYRERGIMRLTVSLQNVSPRRPSSSYRCRRASGRSLFSPSWRPSARAAFATPTPSPVASAGARAGPGAGAIGMLGTSPVNARFALRSRAVHAGALDRSTMK